MPNDPSAQLRMVTMNAYRTRDKRLGNNRGPWRGFEVLLLIKHEAGVSLTEKNLAGRELISGKAPIQAL